MKKFNVLEDFKKAVLYSWNKVPIDYCIKISEKFDNDIKFLIKNGEILLKIGQNLHISLKNLD